MNFGLLTCFLTKWTIGIFSPLNSTMSSLLFIFSFFFFFFFQLIKQIQHSSLFLRVRFPQPPSILVALSSCFASAFIFLRGTWKRTEHSSWDLPEFSRRIVRGVLRKAALLNISVMYYLYCADSNSVCDPLLPLPAQIFPSSSMFLSWSLAAKQLPWKCHAWKQREHKDLKSFPSALFSWTPSVSACWWKRNCEIMCVCNIGWKL